MHDTQNKKWKQITNSFTENKQQIIHLVYSSFNLLGSDT